MLLKTGLILFFLTIKVFKDDVNLLANVSFPSPRTADVFPVIARKLTSAVRRLHFPIQNS